MFILNAIRTQLLSHVAIQTNIHQNISFSHRHPTCTQSPELSNIWIHQLNLPIIELEEVNIMASGFFFLCVDLELEKIVVCFSYFKALYLAFPHLVDSSPRVVTDSRVPGLPGSQKFRSSFHYHPSPPPSHAFKCTLIIPLLVTNHQTHRKDWH